jgi:DNA-binding XRE family transcriptional regulator
MSDEIARRLRQARKEKFATVREAAESLGVPYQTYAAHENGNRAFDNETAAKYARRYHVSLDWLLTGRGTMKEPTAALFGLDRLVAEFQEAYGEEADILREDLERAIDERKKLIERSRQTH